MGRKIPAKKHRGVKDPLVQQAKRLQSLKGKINAPPADPDEQPVPKSLTRLFAPRRPRAPPATPRRPKASPAAPARLPLESARSYSRRLTAATHALIAADDSQEYPVEEAEEANETRRRRPRAGPERPDKRQRQKEKLHAKREQERLMKEQEARSRPRYESLPFGETAHAPPALSKPRRANVTATADRPGRRNLLLSGLLRGEAAGSLTPDALRREQARLTAVQAYRDLKRERRLRPEKI